MVKIRVQQVGFLMGKWGQGGDSRDYTTEMKQKPRWSGKDGFATTTTALLEYAGALHVTFLYKYHSLKWDYLLVFLFMISPLHLNWSCSKAGTHSMFIITLGQCVAYAGHLINICSRAKFLCEIHLLSDPNSVAYSYMTWLVQSVPLSTVSSHSVRPRKGQKDAEGPALTLRTLSIHWDGMISLMFYYFLKLFCYCC